MKTEGYQNILFAMDLSLESTVMLRRVVEIATRFGANLNLIHIMEKINEDNPVTNFELTKEIIDKVMQPYQHLKPSVYIEMGDVQEKILQTALENDIDLIIIGSHGRKGENILLGSTAKGILSDLRCDVLMMSVINYPHVE